MTPCTAYHEGKKPTDVMAYETGEKSVMTEKIPQGCFFFKKSAQDTGFARIPIGEELQSSSPGKIKMGTIQVLNSL